jgi:hypothetical protein
MVGFDPNKKDLTNSQILIASTTSGFISRFLLQPIDVIKIRFQVRLKNSILQKKNTINHLSSFKSNQFDVRQVQNIIV